MTSPAEHRRAAAADAGRSCPYCRFGVKQGVSIAICGRCGTVHHEDCWHEHGACAADACADRAADAAPPPPVVTSGGGSGRFEARPGAAWGAPVAAPSGGGEAARWRVLALVLAVVLLGVGGTTVAILLRDRSAADDGRASGAPERRSAAHDGRSSSAAAVDDGVADPADVVDGDPAGTADTPAVDRPAVGAEPPSGSFYIAQIGSFRERVNAEAEASRLQGLGFPAKVMDGADYEPLRDDYFAVYLGPFDDRVTADREAKATRSAKTQGAFGRLVTAQ